MSTAPPALGETADGLASPEEIGAARSLVHAYRTHGHMAAHLDPLGTEPVGDPVLDPTYHGLTLDALARIPASALGLFVPGETLGDALPRLREIYSGPIAYQIEHLSGHRQRLWLREAIESRTYLEPLPPADRLHALDRLLRVEAFEQYLHRAFLGEKQFSIEGLDLMILMLDEAIMLAAQQGISEAVMGMAHRGRLNVLAHVLRRPYSAILSEFEGRPSDEVVEELPPNGAGDVKYHHGARTSRLIEVSGREDTSEHRIDITLLPNPSHLEFVNPVVAGRVRALQTDQERSDTHPDTSRAIAVMIHGDAAFPGQGVVAETLNLQSLPGYRIAGTLHLIANNQVGFTTDPSDSRSTRYASDLAKGFDIPIIHVNADAVDACRGAIRLAMAFRERFGRDVLIDLVGYRRWGHNEADEPAYTQPQMVEQIKAHPSAGVLYGRQLTAEGLADEDQITARRSALAQQFAEAHNADDPSSERGAEQRTGRDLEQNLSAQPESAELVELSDALLEVPEGFNVHPKLAQQLERRRVAIREGGIDWGHAEALAFSSLLADGVAIRLTGQDTERGTFSHRHMVLHDVVTGERWTPMQHLNSSRARFEVFNSPLSEAACLGFEYGYSVSRRNALVIWEAQFGDFANGAQVIIDQFIASGRSKWGVTSRLTLFLPHGYEGNGPEHSSARLERFLQLAADDNIRIANVTTPAQLYHLLRRQATGRTRRPLVVMTPKGLLRLKESASSLADLTAVEFQPIIDDGHVAEWREDISRLVLCSGRLYYDLAKQRLEAEDTAIARVEQLYPFPSSELSALVGRYPNLEQIVWAQEEPANMGAWRSLRHRVEAAVPARAELVYAGRPWRASPSEGYTSAHFREQDRIVRAALGLAPQ